MDCRKGLILGKKKVDIIESKENIAMVFCCNKDFYTKGIPKEFEVWTINGMCQALDRIDLLFDMHEWRDTSHDYPIPDYYDYLLKRKNKYPIVKPYYSKEIGVDDGLKNVIPYPLRCITKEFGMNLKNSAPMILLYAWYLNKYENRNIKNIYMYGFGGTEYRKYYEMGFSFYQAIGFIRAKGINCYFVTDYEMDDDNDIYGYYRLTKRRIKD